MRSNNFMEKNAFSLGFGSVLYIQLNTAYSVNQKMEETF